MDGHIVLTLDDQTWMGIYQSHLLCLFLVGGNAYFFLLLFLLFLHLYQHLEVGDLSFFYQILNEHLKTGEMGFSIIEKILTSVMQCNALKSIYEDRKSENLAFNLRIEVNYQFSCHEAFLHLPLLLPRQQTFHHHTVQTQNLHVQSTH